MCSQPRPLESGFRSVLFLWRTFTNYVTHCERMSRYEISRRSISLTFGLGGGYCLARHAEHTIRKRAPKGQSRDPIIFEVPYLRNDAR